MTGANAAGRANRRTILYWRIIFVLVGGIAFSNGCGGGGGGGGSDGGGGEPAPDPGTVTGNIFVSPDGSDGNDGRSPEQALKTINAAVAIAAPGDEVVIAPGTYRELVVINSSGEPGKPVVFTSPPGAPAVIDGGQIPGERAVVIEGEWIVLRGVIVENSGDKGILVYRGNNVLIDSVVSRFNNGTGIKVYEGDNNRVVRSIGHDNYDHVRDGENADGISIRGGSGHVIQACIAFNNSDDGFDTRESSGVIVERSIAYRNGAGQHGDGNGFKLSNRSDGNTTARKNIAYENSRRGFTNSGGGGHRFINNTAWNNRVNFQSTGAVLNTFLNNLSLEGRLDLHEATEQSNNSWNLEIQDFGPIITDPDSPDFLTPPTGSIVVDSGTDAEIEFQGAAHDLGALEQGERIADLTN